MKKDLFPDEYGINFTNNKPLYFFVLKFLEGVPVEHGTPLNFII